VTPPPSNRAVIAAAGSGKTEYIIGRAPAVPAAQRVLITTYTRYNCDQIFGRIQTANGCKPPHVSVRGWFSFLMNQAARPLPVIRNGTERLRQGTEPQGQPPTRHRMPMLQYIKTGDPDVLATREHLYVAVTRARRSVAFVVSRKEANYIP
jgi:superfamily I DNA/RNA helicase